MSQTTALDPIAILADPTASLSQTMAALSEAERTRIPSQHVRIGLSSNITIDLLELFLRKHALLNGVGLEICQGNYNDLLGDGKNFVQRGIEQWVIVLFFDNLSPFLESSLKNLKPEIVDALESELRNRFSIAFEIGASFKTIYVAELHRIFPLSAADGDDVVEATLTRFNKAIHEEASRFTNIRFVNLEAAISTLGHSHSFDYRFYLRGKAPYTAALLNEFARQLAIMSRGFGSYYFKALVLDCDNTLWGGVIGEDLLEGIKLSPHDYPGNVFWYAQNEFAALESKGIVLCLCSKNNPDDVDEVIQSHTDMVLRNHQIVIKKNNWNDKSQNIIAVANELNIGLDSIVFLDDSPFECEAMRMQLPMVRTYQVPKDLTEYPYLLQELKELFLGGGVAPESRSKTEQYRVIAEAGKLRPALQSQEEYLHALGLKVELSLNKLKSIQRISELTMKSNQFNLTTRRYSETEIRQLMENPKSAVYSFVVHDKFGNHGLTGVIILKFHQDTASVDSFLMSCRVIGRGIEFAVWDSIVSQIASRKSMHIVAEYVPTEKNRQVADFYDRLGLNFMDEIEGVRRYSAEISQLELQHNSWIEVIDVK